MHFLIAYLGSYWFPARVTLHMQNHFIVRNYQSKKPHNYVRLDGRQYLFQSRLRLEVTTEIAVELLPAAMGPVMTSS